MGFIDDKNLGGRIRYTIIGISVFQDIAESII